MAHPYAPLGPLCEKPDCNRPNTWPRDEPLTGTAGGMPVGRIEQLQPPPGFPNDVVGGNRGADIADAIAAARGFADCEALVVAMLTAMAEDEREKKRRAQVDAMEAMSESEGKSSLAEAGRHHNRADVLHEAALAVQLGQHRTDAYDPEQLATAHRKAAHAGVQGGKARALALSPERRREIAQKASDAALTARRLRAKGE